MLALLDAFWSALWLLAADDWSAELAAGAALVELLEAFWSVVVAGAALVEAAPAAFWSMVVEELEAELSLLGVADGAVDPFEFMSVDEVPVVLEGVVLVVPVVELLLEDVLLGLTPEAGVAPLWSAGVLVVVLAAPVGLVCAGVWLVTGVFGGFTFWSELGAVPWVELVLLLAGALLVLLGDVVVWLLLGDVA